MKIKKRKKRKNNNFVTYLYIKRKYILTTFIFLIVAILSPIVFVLANRIQITKPQAASPSFLHAQGSQIIDSSGQPLVLRGAQIASPLNFIAGWNAAQDPAIWLNPSVFSAMKSWNMNVLRLPVSTWYYNQGNFMTKLDTIVQQANAAGIYVIIAGFDNAKSGSPYGIGADVPKQELVSFWQFMAGHFKDNPMVMFDLLNEPSNLTPQNFLNGGGSVTGSTGKIANIIGFQPMISAIRTAGAQQIIVIPADIANANPSARPSDPNIMYTVHIYSKIGTGSPSSWDSDWGSLLGSYPLFYGEWAVLPNSLVPVQCQPYSPSNADQKTNAFLQYMQQKGINWTAWQFRTFYLTQDTTTFTPTTFAGSWTVCDPNGHEGMGTDIKNFLAGTHSTSLNPSISPSATGLPSPTGSGSNPTPTMDPCGTPTDTPTPTVTSGSGAVCQSLGGSCQTAGSCTTGTTDQGQQDCSSDGSQTCCVAASTGGPTPTSVQTSGSPQPSTNPKPTGGGGGKCKSGNPDTFHQGMQDLFAQNTAKQTNDCKDNDDKKQKKDNDKKQTTQQHHHICDADDPNQAACKKRNAAQIVADTISNFFSDIFANISSLFGAKPYITPCISPSQPSDTPSPTPPPSSVTPPSPTNNPSMTPPAGYSKLIFDDEFNGTTLDTNKWVTCFRNFTIGNGCTHDQSELELYLPDGVSVTNGILTLRAQQRSYVAANGKTYNYTSGMISSEANPGGSAHFSYTYGYAEMRAKIPHGKGLWPAFWTMGLNSWPPEFDIFEILGNAPTVDYMTYHYGPPNQINPSTQSVYNGPDLSADFHVYGFDWKPGVATWYVDGVQRKQFTGAAVSANPMFIIANLAVGGSWPGNPDASTVFPADFQIDYVRVYQ